MKTYPVHPTADDVLDLKSQQIFVALSEHPRRLVWTGAQQKTLLDAVLLRSTYPTRWHRAPQRSLRRPSMARAPSPPCASFARSSDIGAP